jgi:hypothetical protein
MKPTRWPGRGWQIAPMETEGEAARRIQCILEGKHQQHEHRVVAVSQHEEHSDASEDSDSEGPTSAPDALTRVAPPPQPAALAGALPTPPNRPPAAEAIIRMLHLSCSSFRPRRFSPPSRVCSELNLLPPL